MLMQSHANAKTQYGRIRPHSFIFLLLFGFASRCDAALLAMLDEDRVAWTATNVVVVNKDGVVLQNWKGDTRRGEKIDIRALGVKRRVLAGGQSIVLPKPQQETYTKGNRLVLFLVDADKTARRRWKSAPNMSSDGGQDNAIDFSMAWVELDEVYAWKTGYSNFGEVGVSGFATLNELHASVKNTLKTQRAFHAALSEANLSRRAWKIAPFTTQKKYVAEVAMAQLVGLHGAALPVFRRFLFDAKFAAPDSSLPYHMVQAAGRAAIPDLLRYARQEVVFWRTQAPQLKVGWREQRNDSSFDPRLERYYVLSAAFRQLADFYEARAKPIARVALSLCDATPAFDDRRASYGITKMCHNILAGKSAN